MTDMVKTWVYMLVAMLGIPPLTDLVVDSITNKQIEESAAAIKEVFYALTSIILFTVVIIRVRRDYFNYDNRNDQTEETEGEGGSNP